MTRSLVSMVSLAGALALSPGPLALSSGPLTQNGPPQLPPRVPVAPTPPPRPAGPARDLALPVTGSASLAGVVTTDEATARPVRRVVLTLNGGGLRQGRVAVSDDEGRFSFGDLPAGRFNLSGTRPGYVTSYYGARRLWRGPGTAIDLGAGQRITDLAFKLLRGAVITGAVRDPNGQPQANLRVSVLETRFMNGELTWAPVSTGFSNGQTDDRGTYRVYGLPPGNYLVGVAGTPLSTAARMTSDADVQWALQQVQAASRAAAAAATPGASMPAPELGPTLGYSSLYYPGTPDPSAAVTVTLGPAEERTGVDVMMQFVPTARVQGIVTGADGQPVAGAQVGLFPQGRKIVSVMDGPMRASSDQNGRFIIQTVRPGQYLLLARSQNRAPMAVNRVEAMQAVGLLGAQVPIPQSAQSSGSDQWGQIDLAVAGKDLSEVALALQPGMTLSGRVVFEGAAPPDASRTSVSLRIAPGPAQLGGAVPNGPATSAGTFTLTGVVPGLYLMSAGQMSSPGQPAAPGWMLKSILVKGQDALEVPFQIGPHEVVNDVVVTFTDQVTDLSGTLVDGSGKPVPSYFVLVFPTNPAGWIQGSRRMRPPGRTWRRRSLPLREPPAGRVPTWWHSRTSTRRNSTSRASSSRWRPPRSRSRSKKARKRRWT